MALSRSRLTDQVVNVATGSTVGIVTVASNKKVFVKSVVLHNVSTATTTRGHLYYVPNGGSVSGNTRLFDVSIEPQETVYIEPSYPITLTTTGDKISIGSVGSQVNVFVNGDKEV
tara:strand:- start:102 stop:446 length:345 start_codon:yes stop_codon:yes gene_type:complete